MIIQLIYSYKHYTYNVILVYPIFRWH